MKEFGKGITSPQVVKEVFYGYPCSCKYRGTALNIRRNGNKGRRVHVQRVKR